MSLYLHNVDMVNNAYNITLLSEEQIESMKAHAPECQQLATACQTDESKCLDAYAVCDANLIMPLTALGRNPYDIRQSCANQQTADCYDVSHIAEFLDLAHVRSFLGVENDRVGAWQPVSVAVYTAFTLSGDPIKSFSSYVTDLLEAGYRGLIYAGDADLMCNWYGNQAWTKALEWSGKQGFNAADERAFITVDPDTKQPTVDAGVVRAYGNFAFLRIYNSGHMVPTDQPAVADEMIRKFLKNQSLAEAQ